MGRGIGELDGVETVEGEWAVLGVNVRHPAVERLNSSTVSIAQLVGQTDESILCNIFRKNSIAAMHAGSACMAAILFFLNNFGISYYY